MADEAVIEKSIFPRAGDAAEELLRANERFALAAKAVGCLIYDWDMRHNRVERTEGVTEVLGYQLDEVEPTVEWWLERIHPDDLALAKVEIETALMNGDRYTVEYRVRHKNQQYVYLLDRGIVVRDAQGIPVRVVGSTTDINERKQNEREREALLVREKAAREEAEAANRIKDEFLAVLSHELRSPLNPILGWAKLLRSRNVDRATLDRALEAIERNATLQTRLIEDLLDVSRILQGKLSLNITAINLVSTIEAAIETVRLAAEAKSITIKTFLAPHVGSISGDAGRLQQVIWNLLSNAVKFTPSGGQIEVELTQIGSQAQIQVKDTGDGIDPAFLPHVFEYFRQADGSITRSFGGLGLGLAIARNLVELHGGMIQADSLGKDKGATFTITLPILQACSQPKEDQPSVALLPNLQGIKILLVDDNVDQRELLVLVLEDLGATVTAVSSATEVLDMWAEWQPHILLSDIGMPDIDGYMLIRQIRTLPHDRGGRVPAIALTAYAGDSDREQALAAGFQQHITKPVDPNEVIKAILQLTVDS